MLIRRTSAFFAVSLALGCSAEISTPGGTPGQIPDATGGPGAGSGAAPSTGTGTATGGSNPGTAGSGTAGSGNPGTAGSGTAGVSAGGSSTGGSGTVDPTNCTPEVKATSQVPRLTNAQYDRTIRDLLGVTNLTASNGVAPSTLLATDQDGGMTDLAWANYKDVADTLATQVISDPTLKANFLKCTPVAGDATCLHQTVIDFGRRAFRRPLTEAEVARFDNVIAAGPTITPTGTPDEIAQTLLYMFLISPTFLQRAETTGVADAAGHFTLSSYEIASRLSYMLWGTMPDATLDQAADANQLGTTDQIAAQAQRMLQDPKARDMVQNFHAHYLLIDSESHWGQANRDPSLFPAFNTNIASVLSDETLKFFDKITFTPGSTFQDFLTSPIAFVNQDTAPIYGLDPSQFGTDLTETTLDATERPGFLTRLGFLMNFASYTRTSPIYRGAFISKQILGIQIPAPPPGATQTDLPTAPDLDTNRKQVEAQTQGAECIGCHHTYINPPGFVMEAFDAMGQWRTTEADGVPLDTTADVTTDDGQAAVHITSPAELMAAIAASPGAMHQYVAKWVSFGYRREADPADACTVDQLAAKMRAGNYGILDLIAGLTETESFRVRAKEVTQ